MQKSVPVASVSVMQQTILDTIPHRPPFLFIDEIVECTDTTCVATRTIRADEPQFIGHYPGNPIMPGCLGLDGMWQLTGFFLGWLGEPGRGMALSTGEVKFKGMVRPDRKLLEFGIDFKRVMRGRLVLGIADGWLKADGEEIYKATDLRVGLAQDAQG